jgi:ankyrin repeat protein
LQGALVRTVCAILLLVVAFAACSTSGTLTFGQQRGRGFTPLLLAARNGDLATVQRELAAGANNVDQRLKNGMTSLMLASAKGHGKIVRELLAASADVNASSNGGWTALHFAAFQGTARIVEDLVHAGAKVNARTAKGYLQTTPLLSAVTGDQVATARVLLASGAGVNDRGEHGVTPLMTAAANGNAELISLLLQYGADPRLKVRDGATAADVAIANHHPEIAAQLRSVARR